MPQRAGPGCLAQVLTTLVFAAVALIGLELYVDRVRWGVSPDWYRVEIDGDQVRFTCQRFAPVQFARTAAPGVRRIAVLGGSTTFGYPDHPTGTAPLTTARHGFVGVIQATLEAAAPGRYELVNLGVNGGTSHDTLKVFRRALDWDLDGVIVYDGHNEYMSAPAHFQPALWGSALYRALVVLRPRTNTSPGWVGPAAYGGPDHADAIVGQLSANLGRIVELAHDAGLPVVVATQAGNLADFDPSWSTTGPSATGGDPEALWAAHPASAELAWQVGVARLLADQDATAPLRAAADHDGLPFRATTAVNTALRDMAAAAGVVLVDSEAAIRADDDALGDAHFYDWVHPTLLGRSRLGEALLVGLVEAGLVAPADQGALVAPRLPPDEGVEATLRLARGWLQWACVRQHDPAHRLYRARAMARFVLRRQPDNGDAQGILAVADALEGLPAELPTDPDVRARLADLHPTLADLLAR